MLVKSNAAVLPSMTMKEHYFDSKFLIVQSNLFCSLNHPLWSVGVNVVLEMINDHVRMVGCVCVCVCVCLACMGLLGYVCVCLYGG